MTSGTGSVGWGFGDLRKAVSWVPASERESRDSELGETRRICALRAPHVGWFECWRCKSSQHRKVVSLSLHVEKPLKSKRWIKVSYLNQFHVFGFLYMFMNILWTLCLFHISVGLLLGLLCWGFKGVQEEIPSEEASILQIGSVAFPPGQCTSLQLHPCHRLFEQDGHQDTSSASLCCIAVISIHAET